MMLNPSLFLRRALLLDAVVSGAVGLVMMLGSSFLSNFLRLPVNLLFVAGLILLPFASSVSTTDRNAAMTASSVIGYCKSTMTISTGVVSHMESTVSGASQ